MRLPTLEEINAAASLIREYIPCTPQYRWPLLCERCEADVWVKHENHSPIGSFKIRGGITYMASGHYEQVITATRGNHGQSVAYAAQLFGCKATVVIPHGNSKAKNEAMRALGANLIEHGRDFSEALNFAGREAKERKLHFVPSFDRKLVVGVSTYALELFQHAANLDALYVPIGLGSEICGVIAVREALGLDVEIIGVVAENAPTYALSFEQKQVVETESADTFADGVAVRVPNTEALEIILANVSRVVQVSEFEIAQAMRHYFTDTHNVVEGAGASTLAALEKEKSVMRGKRVAVIASGGNIERGMYARILNNTYLDEQG